MIVPQELHVSFCHDGTDYNIDLVKGKKSDHSVEINGTTYAVLGDKEKLEFACKILNSVSLKSIGNSEDLKQSLSSLEEISFPQIQKTDLLGTKALGTKQEFHAWKKDEEENLPKTKEFVAGMFWQSRKNPQSLQGLRSFLGGKEFDLAIKSNKFESFLALFDDLSADELWLVRTTDNRHPLGNVKTKPYEITKEDLNNIRDYLDDIGFSGTVTLSDAKGAYTVTSTKQKSEESPSFSMNSIAKVFTGTLALMTMSPSELESPMELDQPVLSFLKENKPEVYEHLEKPSLLQTMHHDGGFGDYLGGYQKAVEESIQNKGSLPEIKRPEDFLKYADTTTHPLDSGVYSNLGTLLVGLAVQHKCNKPYDELLQEMILDPAKMDVSTLKPENGKFSEKDPCQGMVAGGPSGGYWTTSENLAKLGPWFLKQCKPPKEGEKSQFHSNLELYGREFYVPEDEEVHHNGCSPAGSSCFSVFLQSGVTIAVLSDQGDFMADRIHYTIRRNLIEQKD